MWGLFAAESVDPAWSPLHLISGLLQELADRKPVISLLLCALTSSDRPDGLCVRVPAVVVCESWDHPVCALLWV